MELGTLKNFIYLIVDLNTKKTAVIDPAWDVSSIVLSAKKMQLDITDILITHSHFDHTNGIEELLEQYGNVQVHFIKAEAEYLEQNIHNTSMHRDGDCIHLGNTNIYIIHTPGHTPGSACYSVEGQLITGDTLFIFGCGRCDLVGGDPEQMFNTLCRLKKLVPAETIIRPGHNYGIIPQSTMAKQIIGNPFLHFDSCTAFIKYRMLLHNRQEPYQPESSCTRVHENY